ncbi:encapsulin [Cryobacterium sp. Sr8]|uniref:encapsulin n=1 Tax=Cryobacterium sp. Sr8 TaxID=1259203 RepID=UPI001F54612F|nr:encapsulin [Cryobacterium sp. Sr8]
MDHLLRLAPISDRGWKLIDSEARERLGVPLGARRVVDFDGPHGWTYSATSLGSTEGAADSPVGGPWASSASRRPRRIRRCRGWRTSRTTRAGSPTPSRSCSGAV